MSDKEENPKAELAPSHQTTENYNTNKEGDNQILIGDTSVNEQSDQVAVKQGGGPKKVFLIIGVVAVIAVLIAIIAIAAGGGDEDIIDNGGLEPECNMRYTTKRQEPLELIYELSYCGSNGEYCEEIFDATSFESFAENCGDDADYVDDSYIGQYSYFDDYIGTIQIEPEPVEPTNPEPEPNMPDDCDINEEFNLLGAYHCSESYECQGNRTCDNTGHCVGVSGC